jgi:hypothetical protein
MAACQSGNRVTDTSLADSPKYRASDSCTSEAAGSFSTVKVQKWLHF